MRTPYEQQQEEIKTIKERTFSLKLSDADVERLYKKAGQVGISPEEVLEQFIGDLIDGTYTNGSDERMLANNWFERCDFSMFREQSFLKYLLVYRNIDGFIDTLEDIKYSEEAIRETEMALDKGGYERNGEIYYWKYIVDSQGLPAYSSKEEWEQNEREFIEQEKDQLTFCSEDIAETWNDYLRYVQDQPQPESQEAGVKSVVDWIENGHMRWNGSRYRSDIESAIEIFQELVSTSN